MPVETLFVNKEKTSISFRLTEDLNQFAYRILLYVTYIENNFKDRITTELSETWCSSTQHVQGQINYIYCVNQVLHPSALVLSWHFHYQQRSLHQENPII